VNRERRKTLARALALLEQAGPLLAEAKGIIESAASEERDAFDALPEGLQGAANGQKAEAAADKLDEVVEALGELDLIDLTTTLTEAME
jgi:hypothetical protein